MTSNIDDGVPEAEDLSRRSSRENDESGSLHDTEEESGDENQIRDLFDLDEKAAEELGVHLDGSMKDEPQLD